MEIATLILVCQIAVIACGLVAGVFLTFSDFVMRSLGKAETAAGVEVMQVINREVFKTVFMVLLIGFSVLSPLFVGYAYAYMTGPAAFWIMAGGSVYFVGVFVVSMVFNVPMNGRLDKLDYAGAAAAAYWVQTYLPRWTFWNYVRAISSAAAAVFYLLACLALVQTVVSGG